MRQIEPGVRLKGGYLQKQELLFCTKSRWSLRFCCFCEFTDLYLNPSAGLILSSFVSAHPRERNMGKVLEGTPSTRKLHHLVMLPEPGSIGFPEFSLYEEGNWEADLLLIIIFVADI